MRPSARGTLRLQASRAFLAATVLVSLPSFLEAQWLSPPGEGWLDVTAIYHDTRETFAFDGERRRIFADGRAVTRSVFVTSSVGLLNGMDIWIQVPFHRLRFDDAGGERVSSGVGDSKVWVRLGPSVIGLPAWPVAVRGGIKLDGGAFDVDAEIIPLGEGQRDWEVMLEVGRSFYPLPLWTMGWVGYRWRLANQAAHRTPGDEIFWWWTLGGELREVGWQFSVEGLVSDAWMFEGLEISTARRRLHQVFAEGNYPLGPGRLKVGARVPLSGRNLPAGTAVTTGYFFRW